MCVYSNVVSWSDCDPESMLRSKTVGLKRASSGGSGNGSGIQSDLECPRTRILTKDCKIKELPLGSTMNQAVCVT